MNITYSAEYTAKNYMSLLFSAEYTATNTSELNLDHEENFIELMSTEYSLLPTWTKDVTEILFLP